MLNFIQILGEHSKDDTEPTYTSQTQAKSVSQSFLSLADAVLYLKRGRELEQKIEETRDILEKRLIALETLKVDISDEVTKLKDTLGEVRNERTLEASH